MTDARRERSSEIDALGVDFAAKERAFEAEFGAALVEVEPLKMVTAEETSVPPERVRFTAPVKVRLEGEKACVDGVTLNLSVRGLALCAPVPMRARERVWVSFRLDLGAAELSLLCEVIWSAPAGDRDRTYGLRFVSITEEEQRRVKAAVAERSEGRSAEWPLPVLPDPAPSPHRSPSPWVTAAAGMAAGIGLALALSVIPSRGVTQTATAFNGVSPSPLLASEPVLPAVPSPERVLPVRPEASRVEPAVAEAAKKRNGEAGKQGDQQHDHGQFEQGEAGLLIQFPSC